VSATSISLGEEISVSAIVKNVRDYEVTDAVNLYTNRNAIDSKPITLLPGESGKVDFQTKLGKGIHKIAIGYATPVDVKIYPHHYIDITKFELFTHCSETAKPCEFGIDKINNRYTIKAGGTDFLHAEDSYGAIYLKGVIKGNFIATLKVLRFEGNSNPWYRAGVFLRNDISRSHGIETGSLGSVLMYATPKLSGIQWDEFGDGCMHRMGESRIHEDEFPIWLKLVRHGNTFTGYVSYDGINWGEPMHTNPVPGLADVMDIGMAAGTIDQIPALVVLENFILYMETDFTS